MIVGRCKGSETLGLVRGGLLCGVHPVGWRRRAYVVFLSWHDRVGVWRTS